MKIFQQHVDSMSLSSKQNIVKTIGRTPDESVLIFN